MNDLFLPTQGSIDQANIYRYNTAAIINYPIEGNIVTIYYPQDTGNISKREIEYDVEPVVAGIGRIRNAILGYGFHGVTADEEIILQPASLILPTGVYNSTTVGPAANTDGDRVIVQFVNGSWLNPIITHILNHRQRGRQGTLPAQYNNKLEILASGPSTPTPAPGYTFGTGGAGSTAATLTATPGTRYKHTSINGTHVAVDSNGDIFINFKNHPDPSKGTVATAATKKLIIQNNGTDYVKIEKDSGGNLIVKIGEIVTGLTVQFGNGAQKAILGDLLATLFDAHIHPTPAGPSSPPAPPNNFATVAGLPADPLSTKIKLPTNI